MLKVLHLPVRAELTKVVRKEVGPRTEVIVIKLALHSHIILVHKIFPTDLK